VILDSTINSKHLQKQLSEEGQEALSKDLKHFREHNMRKCSRIANEDLLNNLLISSDLVITSLRENFYIEPKKMFDETYTLLDLDEDIDKDDENNDN
jgi:hypothetical protein